MCCSSFNGAALFRARNYPVHQSHRLVIPQASTGPRSFERGINTSCFWLFPSTNSLQRGRALSSAEFGQAGDAHQGFAKASTGPRSFERGIGRGADDGVRVCGASTGPRSFERGIIASPRPPAPKSPCFNGAALFRARNSQKAEALATDNLASTGPRSFERGIDHDRDHDRDQPSRFNGAALFRARNWRPVEV